MNEEMKNILSKLIKLIMMPGGLNLMYESLQDFRIRAEKDGQYDFLLMPCREMEETVFELMSIQKGEDYGEK